MWDEHILDCLKRKRDICIKTIPRMFFSLSGYNILVNMESIQGNHDRREPILRKIASDSFFPNPLSPFRQGPLPLQWPEIPSRALHLLDAGPAGEATYVLCRNSIVQMNTTTYYPSKMNTVPYSHKDGLSGLHG